MKNWVTICTAVKTQPDVNLFNHQNSDEITVEENRDFSNDQPSFTSKLLYFKHTVTMVSPLCHIFTVRMMIK